MGYDETTTKLRADSAPVSQAVFLRLFTGTSSYDGLRTGNTTPLGIPVAVS